MLLSKSIFLNIILIAGIPCPILSATDYPAKQLFLSRRVVTSSGEHDGGVIVGENGVIEAVLDKDSARVVIAESFDTLRITDGGNWALMAGAVDSHVHVNEPGRTCWEGFVTATQAAAAGGITTIVDMPLNSFPTTTSLEHLKEKVCSAKNKLYVDVGFWGGVIPGNQDELKSMVDAGVVGFKCFLVESGLPDFPLVRRDDVIKALVALNGTQTVLAFHAELSINSSSFICQGQNCPSTNPILFETYAATHPKEMELAAASLIASILNTTKTDVHIHVVHVSAEGVVPILERAREARIKTGYKGWRGGISAETCNHYLTLSSEYIPPGRTEFKCSPPIRDHENKEKLWQYIKEKRLDMITSDHSPTVPSLKGENFLEAWGGIASVQFDIPLFWTEAKARGYSLSDVSRYLSAGPARLCGMQDKKGAIRPGLDADLIYFDPDASFVVTPEIIRYKNKLSPYMYRILTGKVMKTILRGKLVYSDDDLIGGPSGKMLLNEHFINAC